MDFSYCPSCGNKGTVQKLDNTNYECTNCQWHFWNNAKGSIGLVFVQGQKLLVCERGREPYKGMYDLPGGFIDFGESAYDAAIREAKEELTVTIARDGLELIDVYYNDYNPGIFTIDVIFFVRAWQGDIKLGDAEIAALDWKPFSFINDPQFCEKFYTGLDKVLSLKL